MTNSSATDIIPSSPELPPGYELLNFTIERKLGRGGFGITYLARESASDRPVVIKENFVQECSMRNSTNWTLTPSGNEGTHLYEWALTRFLDEARLLIRLSHPCIVQVLTVFKALGTAYYVMPFVEGAELHHAAPAPKKINEAWLRPILEQLLSALSYLHGQHLLHRDIKPSNILLRPDGNPLLIDFGTAREKDSTHTLTCVGTPGYSPSEQFTTHGKNGPWTDIYSLGATCYHLITGELPQDAVSRLEEDEQPPLAGRTELKSRFSHEFLAAIDKAMSVARRDRWQSAQEWLDAMQPKQAETPVKSSSAKRQSAEQKTAADSSKPSSGTSQKKDDDTDWIMGLGLLLGGFVGLIECGICAVYSGWKLWVVIRVIIGMASGAGCGGTLGALCAWFGIGVSKILGNFIGALAGISIYVIVAVWYWNLF